MINIQIGENKYQLPHAHEFTVADQRRIEAAQEKYKSAGLRYWSLALDIPYSDLKKLEQVRFNTAAGTVNELQRLLSVILDEWEKYDYEKAQTAFEEGIETVTIDGEVWNIPQNLDWLPMGKFESLDQFQDLPLWKFIPLMLAIMLEREGWDYEEAIKANDEAVLDRFSKCSAIDALKIHFFFRLQGKGYNIPIADDLLRQLMKENGLEPEGILSQGSTEHLQTTNE